MLNLSVFWTNVVMRRDVWARARSGPGTSPKWRGDVDEPAGQTSRGAADSLRACVQNVGVIVMVRPSLPPRAGRTAATGQLDRPGRCRATPVPMPITWRLTRRRGSGVTSGSILAARNNARSRSERMTGTRFGEQRSPGE